MAACSGFPFIFLLFASALAFPKSAKSPQQPQCNLYSLNDPLSTSNPPFLIQEESGFIHFDELTLKISVSTKYSSVDIVFDGATNPGASLTPPGNLATKWTIDNIGDPCWTNYTLMVPWAAFQTGGMGGLVRHDYASEITFSGVAVITMTEQIDIEEQGVVLSRTRTVADKLVFVVEFPMFVETDIAVTTYSSPVDLVAIIHQGVGALSPVAPRAIITVDLLTKLQSPYKYDTGSMTAQCDQPSLTVGMTAHSYIDCPNTPGDCEQTWRIMLYPLDCSVHGIFTIGMKLICQDFQVGDCPIVPAVDDVIVFEISTADYCPQTIDSIEIHANMAVFRDIHHNHPKDDFIHGQVAYFVATAGSTQATIDTVEIVEISTAAPYRLLFLPLNIPNYPTQEVNLEIAPVGSTTLDEEAYFSFTIHSSIFNTPPNGQLITSVQCTLRVEFANNGLLESTHKSILQRLLAENEVSQLEVKEEIAVKEDPEGTATTGYKTTGGAATYAPTAPATSKEETVLTPSFVTLLSVFLFSFGMVAGYITSHLTSGPARVIMEPRKSSGIDVESMRGQQRSRS